MERERDDSFRLVLAGWRVLGLENLNSVGLCPPGLLVVLENNFSSLLLARANLWKRRQHSLLDWLPAARLVVRQNERCKKFLPLLDLSSW